jgi:glyoxylase-like metal-dependent hydrolase (beta-lactamase superfamily II)
MLRALKLFVLLLLALVLFAAGGLAWAHLAIRQQRTPLPDAAALAAFARQSSADLPIHLSLINTASQAMPRSAVLDPKQDPQPTAPYVMSYPSFALQWADGRILLIDAGMTRAGAIAFGKPIELLGGAAPIEPHGSVAEQLGSATARVRGAIFTHLHADHVGGIAELCGGHGDPIRVFMGGAQDEQTNYTTRSGRKLLAQTGCVSIERLSGEGLLPVDGFPGVAVIRAGGHTPGSQIVLALVKQNGLVRRYAFTGDIVNNRAGVEFDIGKPLLYRLLIVPEDETRQGELRRFLRGLATHDGYTLLVSHDQLSLEALGLDRPPA